MKQPRGAAGGDLLFFIFFLIVLGIVWTLTGGPERSISREGPFLNPPFPLGNESAYSVPGVTIPSTGGTVGGTEEEETTLEGIISSIRRGIGQADEDRSPFAGSVQLSVGRAKASSPDDEYLVLKTSQNLENRVVISPWRIESSVTLAGTTLGEAAYLPYSGQVNTESPVALGPNATVYIVTGRSPIGSSFRTNLCTGYFEQFQDFAPSLKEECPLPEAELGRVVESGFIPNQSCIDYVEDIDRCEFTLTSIPASVGTLCQNFITETLTYSGCIDAHRNEPNFYTNEWRIFLDRDQELWKGSRERIRLLDGEGRVITSVSY